MLDVLVALLLYVVVVSLVLPLGGRDSAPVTPRARW
jgi:hypothetical protein